MGDEILKVEKMQMNLKKVEVNKSMVEKFGNIVNDSVPIRNDEKAHNPEGLLIHHDVLRRISGNESKRVADVVGHHWYFLKDEAGVLLIQPFIHCGISWLRSKGYCLPQLPFLMNKDDMTELAQWEQFDEELGKVTGDADDKHIMAILEQPICAFLKDDWTMEKTVCAGKHPLLPYYATSHW